MSDQYTFIVDDIPEFDESDDPYCPTCEEDHFETWHGVKNHHARVHGVSIARVKHECDYCGTVYMEDRSNFEMSEENFCSKECWKKGVSRRNIENGHAPPEREVGSMDYVTRECETCGKELTRHPSQFPGERAFCSRECCNEWQRMDRGMEPVDAHGHSWRTYRRAILKRDEFTCQKCGYVGVARASNGETRLHVHHIVPRRRFESKLEANKPTNVITLCHDCHVDVEQRNAPCPTPSGDLVDGYDYYRDGPWAEGTRPEVDFGSKMHEVLTYMSTVESSTYHGVDEAIDLSERSEGYASQCLKCLYEKGFLERWKTQDTPTGWPSYEYEITEEGEAALTRAGLRDRAQPGNWKTDPDAIARIASLD